MIKNVVFDFGQVLVRFDPMYMTERYVNDADDARLVAEVVFDRLYWDKLDAGTISDEEVVSASLERLPERLHDAAAAVYYNWIYNLPGIDGMEELVEKVKRKGKSVFLLSNISTYFASHANEFSVLEKMDKCIFSATAGHIKPHADMFAYLCEQCGIRAEETLFIDDNPDNIAGAEGLGIKGYLFDGDAVALEKYLDEYCT